jgi:hypothetical protein
MRREDNRIGSNVECARGAIPLGTPVSTVPDKRGTVLTGRAGYLTHCTTDHTKVAVPETPSVSVAVTVTV